MDASPSFFVALAAMAVVAFICRAGGFFLMRFIPLTPRLEAAIGAIPISVMVGIIMPTLVHARPAELLSLAGVIAVMKVLGNDLIAALAGVAIVAMARFLGL